MVHPKVPKLLESDKKRCKIIYLSRLKILLFSIYTSQKLEDTTM
uniref:Uncharacterized protein n=1 Tax=Arundo donax TaxID=35708 RepID=A0A0A9C652_ARUDO